MFLNQDGHLNFSLFGNKQKKLNFGHWEILWEKKKKSCSFSEKSEKKKPKSVYYLWWKKEKCRKLWIVLFWAFLFLHLKRCGKKKRKKNIFLFENLKNNTEDHFVALLERMLNFLSVKAFFPFFFVTVSKVVCFYCVFSKKKSKNRKKGWKSINSNRIFQSFGKSGFGDVGTPGGVRCS